MRHAEYLKECLVLSDTVYCKCQICSKSPDLIFPLPIPQLLSWFRKSIILSLYQKLLYVYLLTTHLFSQGFIFLGNFSVQYSLYIEKYTYLKNRATFTLRKPNLGSRNKTLQGPTPHSKLPILLSSRALPYKTGHYSHFHWRRIIWPLFLRYINGIMQYVLGLLTVSF